VEREAFARAWRFLNYRPAAKWAAIAAAVATGVLYLFLLFVLGLFADLMVSHGRIPSFRSLNPTARDAFIQDWAALSEEERQQLLEKIGSDPRTAGELAKVSDPADLPASEQEFVWRARVFEILEERVNATAAALTLPAFSELSPRLQRGLFRRWQELLPRERDERLRLIQEERPGLALPADPAKLLADQQELLWRAHLVMLLREDHPEAARAFREDRQNRETLQEGGTTGTPEFLADSGILSLIVRSSNHPFDRYYAPVLGTVARIWTGTWRWGNVPYLTRLLVFAAILALLRAFAMFASGYLAARATVEASNRLRRAVYHHTFRLGTLAFRSLGFSEAVGIFTRQLEAVHEGLYVQLTVVYREPVKFGLLLALALVLNVWLSLAFLLFALLVWLIGGQVAAYFRRQERAATRRAGEQLALLQESLSLMRLVKGYLMELFNQARVERQLAEYARAQMRRYRGEAIYRPVLLFLGTLAGIVLLYVAGLIVLSGHLGVARAVTLATALVSLYWPALTWLQNRRVLRRALEAAVILFKFLDRPGEVGQVVGAEFLPPLREQLEFDNVSLKEAGTKRVLLENVSLAVPAGHKVALVGPDDMEKHALVYLIARLLDPDSGEIRIDQHNLRWVTFDSLRAQVGLVLQRHLVFNDTVANNIGCGDSSYDLPKIIEAAKIAHAHQFIQKLPKGYETAIGEMGHYLNVGEQFRVALARAILRDPALVIIEEPPTVLDDDTKALLDDTFARVLPDRTVIFLPHRMSTIRSCNRIFLLHHGRIEAAGDHRELLVQSELYRHLQYLEFNVFSDQMMAGV
jgi:ATP-binding cassette, subfamily B, bacterial